MIAARVLTIAQSIAVVGACAAIGLAISRFDHSSNGDALMLSSTGAIIGLVGVVVGLIVRPKTREFERRESSRLGGLRFAMVSFVVATCGFLIAVFLWPQLGWWIGTVGSIGGIVGIIIHNISAAQKARGNAG